MKAKDLSNTEKKLRRDKKALRRQKRATEVAAGNQASHQARTARLEQRRQFRESIKTTSFNDLEEMGTLG